MLFVLFETLRVQTLMVQVARRSASVLKRRKSRNRMEPPDRDRDRGNQEPNSNINSSVDTPNTPAADSQMKTDEGDVVFYMEEPTAGNLFNSLGNCFNCSHHQS